MKVNKKENDIVTSPFKKQTPSNSPILGIPNDVLLYILSFVDIQTNARFARVCQYFNNIAGDDRLWKQYLPNDKVKDGNVENSKVKKQEKSIKNLFKNKLLRKETKTEEQKKSIKELVKETLLNKKKEELNKKKTEQRKNAITSLEKYGFI